MALLSSRLFLIISSCIRHKHTFFLISFFSLQEMRRTMIKLAAPEIVSGISGDSEERLREVFRKAEVSGSSHLTSATFVELGCLPKLFFVFPCSRCMLPVYCSLMKSNPSHLNVKIRARPWKNASSHNCVYVWTV
jgi:hypothetical protein